MAYISRSRSRSVSTTPFTRATGLSVTWRGAPCGAVVFATAVGACEATWAEAADSATRSRAPMGSWRFMIPRSILARRFRKKRGEYSSPLFVSRQFLLEYGRDVLGVVGFVRFAKVALTAELRRRRRIRVGDVVDVRVVGTVHEEEGGVVLAAAVTRDRALGRGCVYGHHVLVVAGRAKHIRLAGAVDAVGIRPGSRRQRGPTVVGYELRVIGARGHREHTVGKHQAVGGAGADGGILAHRVIVGVVAGRCAVVSEQGRNRLGAVGRIRQKADLLFVRLVGHHVFLGDVAVMAAQAEQDAADFLATRGNRTGQDFHVASAVTELDGGAVQRAGVLA